MMLAQSRSRGVTLIEVLISVAIIGIAFGVLALTQATTLRVTADSRGASDATEFANRRLEDEIRATLASFAPRQAACPVGSPCVTTINQGRFVGESRVVTAGTGYFEAGLVRITVSLTRPANVAFSRVVSCLDVNPPPSIAIPAPCPAAVP